MQSTAASDNEDFRECDFSTCFMSLASGLLALKLTLSDEATDDFVAPFCRMTACAGSVEALDLAYLRPMFVPDAGGNTGNLDTSSFFERSRSGSDRLFSDPSEDLEIFDADFPSCLPEDGRVRREGEDCALA